MARPLAVPHGIQLHLLTGTHGSGDVFADPGRLRQILLNLLANGIKYNRAGGSVTLSCQPGMIQGGTGRAGVRFMVQDTGLGIVPEKLDKLFVPFERLGAENSVIEGTGLGLSLCKRLVEAMQGQIGFHSVEGEGSRFWIELPSAAGSSVSATESGDTPENTETAEQDSAAESRLLYSRLYSP